MGFLATPHDRLTPDQAVAATEPFFDERPIQGFFNIGNGRELFKTASTARAIADELAKAPSCRRIVFETGRMARSCSTG
jgi:hypothetical protein